MKTLAIRLEEDVHAQLSVIAQLQGITITEAIRTAIESYLEAKRSDPELTAQADEVLAGIDREAATRREAIATLFEGQAPAPAKGRRSRRAADGD
jgi:hypothetical protein